MNRNKYYNYIDKQLHTLAHRITTNGKLNMLHLHLHSENFYLHLFNLLYDKNLKNLNDISQNVEAIDLIDHDNKIMIQVSSTSTKQKIESALNKEKLKEYQDYRFKFISIAKDATNLRDKTYKNPHSIEFNPLEDIYDIHSLLNTILSLDIDKLKTVYEFIQKELGEGESGNTRINNQLTSKLGKSTIIGREKELKEIDQQLNSSNTLLLINGIGGVGKSTIASYYLHSHKEQFNYYGFFEGLDSFIVELREPLDLKAEKPQEAFLEALSKLRKLEGDKLLVLDDVKEIEENRDRIDGILGLKDSGYKILFTSREDIENITPYYLDVLSLDDAKALFNSIYHVEDEALLEEILGYLDCHAFFVEKTAHSIKRNLTPQMLKEKFENGEFAQISVKRKQSFDKFLNQLFTLDGLDDEEVLMLKQFSALPSIEIDFESLEYVFQKKENSEFEELLDFLSQKGWLSKLEESYKLHQIIKEYILNNHSPSFKEIEVVMDSFNALIEDSADAQVAVDNRENIIYFESFVDLLNRLKIQNKKVGTFFNNFGLIYCHLSLYQKAKSLYLKALKVYENLLGEEHLYTATSYNNLAVLYRHMGEYQKAEPLYLKALEIWKKVLGEEDSETAKGYNNLAGFYENIGDYQKAVPLYLKVLKIWEKVLGEDHPHTATSYNNLALLYNNMGEYQKAESLYLKSLKIKEKVLEVEHPSIATSYNNLAVFYYGQGDYKRAYNYIKRAIEIWSKVLLSSHPNLINAKKDLEMIKKMLKGTFPSKSYQNNQPINII